MSRERESREGVRIEKEIVEKECEYRKREKIRSVRRERESREIQR